MSHEIRETDGIAFVGHRPWHQLGVEMAKGATANEMLVAAGLDWAVEKLPLTPPNGIAPTEDHFLICRQPNDRHPGRIIDVVGPRFQPIQNIEMFDVMQKMLDAVGLTMNTAGSIKDGEIIFALASTEDMFVLPGDDVVKSYVLMLNSHKGGVSFKAFQTNTRVVCQNTVNAALREVKGEQYFRMYHSNKLDDGAQKRMMEILKLGKGNFEKFQQAAEKLSKTPFREEDSLMFLIRVTDFELYDLLVRKGIHVKDTADLFQITDEKDKPMFSTKSPIFQMADLWDKNPGHDMISAKGTAWGAFNVLTFWCDHVTARTQEKSMINNTMGTLQKLKMRALDDLLAV